MGQVQCEVRVMAQTGVRVRAPAGADAEDQKQNMVFQPFQGELTLSCGATDADSFRNLLSHPLLAALTI